MFIIGNIEEDFVRTLGYLKDLSDSVIYMIYMMIIILIMIIIMTMIVERCEDGHEQATEKD
jgi:hypothetical protein